MQNRLILNTLLAGITAIAIGTAVGPARADHGGDTFYTLYVFGDSSSDNGNFFAEFGDEMDPTFALFYPNGAFTNGQVWGEHLVGYGVADEQDNRAFGGATTGTYGEPARIAERVVKETGLRTQIDDFEDEIMEPESMVELDGHDLVGVWAGFNDYLFGGEFEEVDDTPATVVANIADAIVRLDGLGARHIMVFNLPDLSRVPLASFVEPQQAIQLGTASAVHNALLAMSVSILRPQLDAEIILIDIFAAMDQIIGNPGRFGFTNATDSCLLVDGAVAFPNPFSPCRVSDNGTPENPFDDILAPAGFVFWDPLHPSTEAHRLVAEFIEATLAARAFGLATRGSAVDGSGSEATVTACADPADVAWCF